MPASLSYDLATVGCAVKDCNEIPTCASILVNFLICMKIYVHIICGPQIMLISDVTNLTNTMAYMKILTITH